MQTCKFLASFKENNEENNNNSTHLILPIDSIHTLPKDYKPV